jgi:uncharacterized protein YndB with AHSA1/START domain
MNEKFIASVNMMIGAPPSKVWDALTKPELIKQYFFGTQVTTDWKVGSPVTYTGEWEGKKYVDKGTVLEVVPEKLLVSTYWSAFSGLPDIPENHNTVRYELSSEDGGTRLVVTQDNNATQEAADHSTSNWKMVLEGMKKLLEG